MIKECRLILLTLLIIGLMSSFTKDTLVSLESIEVETATVFNYIYASGYIEQSDKNIISIDQNGIVETLNFNIGDSVKKGDIIMVIKKTDYIPYVSAFNIDGNLIGKSDILSTQDEVITIKSNVDGKIISIPDTVGTGVLKGIPFLSVSNSNNLIANIKVSERYAESIAIGQNVILTGEGFSGEIYGNISSISPIAKKEFSILSDNSDVLIDIEVSLNPYQVNLISGLSVSASIQINYKEEAVIIPYTCIFQEERQEYVYLLTENEITKTAITTGYELEDCIEVLYGIKAGDILILANNLGEYYE